MAFKTVEVPDIGTVVLYKRRRSRSLRISIDSGGKIKVSLPTWVPYSTGLQFVKSKSDWISNHKPHRSTLLVNNQRVGKAHRLVFTLSQEGSVTKKVKDNTITVSYPTALSWQSEIVQAAAQSAVKRALKIEADSLLPQRLAHLSRQTQLEFNGVSTRSLKSRWGSCNHKKDIVLNIFLLQLPWHLIDYVLIHELVHTKVLQHGPKFWEEFEKHLPNAKSLRKEIRQYQPDAISS